MPGISRPPPNGPCTVSSEDLPKCRLGASDTPEEGVAGRGYCLAYGWGDGPSRAELAAQGRPESELQRQRPVGQAHAPHSACSCLGGGGDCHPHFAGEKTGKWEWGPECRALEPSCSLVSTGWGVGPWRPHPLAGHLHSGPAGASGHSCPLCSWGQGPRGASTYGW